MFATRMRGTSRSRLLSLALVGGMALGATAGSPEMLALMSPATSSSTMPRPSVSTTTAATSSTTASQTTLQVGVSQQAGVSAQQSATGAKFVRATRYASVGSWTPVSGHSSYAMSDFRGDPYAASFGQCTWYAWYRHRWLPLMRLGDAGSWPANAHRFGLRVTSRPVRGATVIFAPGVQGASAVGHAGVVERVLRGGWLLISEMNFAWNGGGWGRVDYRYVRSGWGVSFII